MTDWAYREYGLRVQWTIFGGVEFTPTPELRRAVVERFGSMTRGREEKIFAFEIANEGWQNGFGDEQGRVELHALAQLLKTQIAEPRGAVGARSRAVAGRRRPSIAVRLADLLTLHLPRAGMEKGAHLEHVSRSVGFSRVRGRAVPWRAATSPSGPSRLSPARTIRLCSAALAAVTYGSGIGAFVLHTGPGVRGGGAADLARARHSNLWELPAGARIAAALSALIRALPGDFSNWQKQDALAGADERHV